MARDFFDELSDTITRTTKDFSKKASQIYETQKIKSKIASEEQMVQKLKADIGNVIFEKYKDGTEVEDGLKGFCEEIQQHLQIIAGYKDAAADLKGQKICPACGKSIDRSATEGEVVDSKTEEPVEAEEGMPEEASDEHIETVEESETEPENASAKEEAEASETCDKKMEDVEEK